PDNPYINKNKSEDQNKKSPFIDIDTSNNSEPVNMDLSTTKLPNNSITDISVLEILSNPWKSNTIHKNLPIQIHLMG
ncbi:8716_t:CDS:1, partial [Gigaspora margarita]